MSEDMVKYYRERAREYEEVYRWRDPHRQEEQAAMERALLEAFQGCRVLDVGCGTGYWTQRVSRVARSMVGVDINETVLEIARSKDYYCPVEFRRMDAYQMELDQRFTGLMATFMLSHVKRSHIQDWLTHLHGFLEPGASVFFADNVYIEGVGGPLVVKEGDPNTYKLRTLKDGSQHLIVKNYFHVGELVQIFGAHSRGVGPDSVFHGHCFWWVSYRYEL